jgi:hypothetical protein
MQHQRLPSVVGAYEYVKGWSQCCTATSMFDAPLRANLHDSSQRSACWERFHDIDERSMKLAQRVLCGERSRIVMFQRGKASSSEHVRRTLVA